MKLSNVFRKNAYAHGALAVAIIYEGYMCRVCSGEMPSASY